jgi:flagellar basal-body rod protein FlgF
MSAQNVANMTTPGYKRRFSFSGLISGLETQDSSKTTFSQSANAGGNLGINLSPGKLIQTGKPYDLAIAGSGFFAVKAGGEVLYTRQGQFERTADGRLVTADGNPLQVEGGGDLILRDGQIKVLDDGSVLEDGEPAGKLAIINIPNAQAVQAIRGNLIETISKDPQSVAAPSVHQGMLEASNVDTGAEMVSMMAALRRAETGQRLVSVYDDLMGRVLTTVGQSS